MPKSDRAQCWPMRPSRPVSRTMSIRRWAVPTGRQAYRILRRSGKLSSTSARSDCLPPLIALKDIGEFGAAAFLSPNKFLGQAIDLAGDELILPEVAEHLSRTKGHQIQFQQIPEDQLEKLVGHDFALMFRWFNEVGYSVDIPALRQRYGVPLTSFADLIKTADWAR